MPGHITEVLLSVPDGDDNALANAHHTLDTFDLEPVVRAQFWGQRFATVSSQSPRPARVEVIVEIAQDYGSRLLAGDKPSLRAVLWPRLLQYLSRG